MSTMIWNLTPHAVVATDPVSQEDVDFPSEGELRAPVEHVQVGSVPGPAGNWPIYETRFGPITLPERWREATEKGDWLIVSRITAEALQRSGYDTSHFLIPDDVVRGPNGQAVACKAFARL